MCIHIFLKTDSTTATFIETKSGQIFYFYDQIQVTRIMHLAYYKMFGFCTMIPISLFITKIQNLKWGCNTFWRVLYIIQICKHCIQANSQLAI
jgi:hypothetical protein